MNLGDGFRRDSGGPSWSSSRQKMFSELLKNEVVDLKRKKKGPDTTIFFFPLRP